MDFEQIFSLIFRPKISLYLDEDRNFSFQNAIFDAQNEDLFTYFLSSSLMHYASIFSALAKFHGKTV